MEKHFEYFYQRLAAVTLKHIRPLIHFLDEPNRLVGIKGARGAGKSTLLLQYAKTKLPLDHRTLYVSLDNPAFASLSLENLASQFVKLGGETLLLDEVHRYEGWSEILKFLYDQFPDLRIIFTGSSILHIDTSTADLSRRAVFRTLNGLSFREYLNWHHNTNFESVTLESLLRHHSELSRIITADVRPLLHFREYIQDGYYPFHLENRAVYDEKLREITRISIESDLRMYHELRHDTIQMLLKLLSILADSVPFTPNIAKLSERTGTTRNHLIRLLELLEQAKLIHRLFRDADGITRLQKPDKLFLDNTNLMNALSWSSFNVGAMRETFFVNQVRPDHQIQIAKNGDFIVNQTYTFKIGGMGKTDKQIEGIPDAYITADDIEYGYQNKIPLWLFGFLY